MINPPGNLLKRTDWDLTTYIHLSSFCKSATFNIIITSESLLYLIQSLREATKNGYFSGIFSKKKGGGSGIPKLNVKFWWPLFLALKRRLFWPKVAFLFLNVPRNGELFLKNTNFLTASLSRRSCKSTQQFLGRLCLSQCFIATP